jgi:6-phosphogluconolactonase (cycloisomerase 2 family)
MVCSSSADYLVAGSDSGRIVILEFNPQKNALERVHMETYGKSGCRRIVPGQYLAVDPKGRAVMIGSFVENSFHVLRVRLSSFLVTKLRAC